MVVANVAGVMDTP